MKINNMMKQAQKMQTQMMQIQEKLAEERVEGSAGGGMVKAVFTGQGDLVEMKIDPEVINPSDVEMLEDLIAVAVNDGLQKSRELTNSRMGVFTNALGALGLGF
jgi:DNA-binding YbaB/EbfC family protein